MSETPEQRVARIVMSGNDECTEHVYCNATKWACDQCWSEEIRAAEQAAREDERLRTRIANDSKNIDTLGAQIDGLRAEIAAAKREAQTTSERLAWLDANSACDVEISTMPDQDFDGLVVEFDWPDDKTLCEAIDAAIQAESEEKSDDA